MKWSAAAENFNARIGGYAIAIGVIGVAFAQPAWAGCKSDEECKSGRICQDSQCVNPAEGKEPQATCTRDIDCAADDICEQNMCIPTMPNSPGAQPQPVMPPANQPQPSQPPPPPPPSPEFQPPPNYYGQQPPPPPPPGYLNPPYPYPRRIPAPRPMQLMPLRFDLLVGATYIGTESSQVDWNNNDFGISVDAQLAKGIAPHLALGIRAGTVLIPYAITASTAYGALGLYSNTYHWGLFLGAGTAVSPDAGIREPGFVIDVPVDWALGPFFKIGFALGLGFYRDFEQQNIRFCIGL